VLWGQLQTQGRTEPELRRARAAFDRTLAVHPDVAAGHYYRGCVLGWLAKPNEAAAAFRRALELDPRLVDAERQLRAVSRGERVTDVAMVPRRRPDDAPPVMGPHRPQAPPRHELLTPGYKRLYWVAGILLAMLVAANFILRLDADF
jgi:tetratricopeptide (TPR) repeat protein